LNSSEDDLLEVAWYLSKYGKSQPPVGLGVLKWKEAYDLFYPRFGWMNDQGAPAELFHSAQRVHQRLSLLSDVTVVRQRREQPISL